MGEITNLPISTKRITELDANTSIEDSDLFVTVNGGVDKNISGLVIKDEMAQVFDSLNLITSTSLADADATLTAAQLIGGEFTITPTVARTLTTDTVANIIAGLTGSVDGSNFEFTVINLADFDVTIAAGVGVTLVGNMVVKDGSATFRVKRLTSSTVSVTRLETGVFTPTPIDDLGLAPNPVVNIDSITSTGFITTSATSMGTFPSGSPKVGVLTSIARTSTFVSQTLHDFIPDQIFTRIITSGTPAAWKRLDEPSPTKAWVLFNGVGTVSILGSSNISSITDRGVGLYTINLITPMPNTNYAVSGYASRGSAGATAVVMGDTSVTRTTSAIPIQVRAVDNVGWDAGEISLVVTGD